MTTRRDVPLCKPSFRGRERELLDQVLASGWLAEGPLNAALAEGLAARSKRRHCELFNSWTSAAFLLLKALDIRGEVIVPSFTFVASANIVEAAGARCIFADIRLDDLCLDPAAVEALITPRTEAIMPIHYAGLMADVPKFADLARRHRLAFIEDSAECLGASVDGHPPGELGYGIFSFFPTKNITTGEGGAITLDDETVARRLRTLASHGIDKAEMAKFKTERPWHREASLIGYNMRMSQLNAALGVAQLERLDDLNRLRREVARGYRELLGDLPGVVFHDAPPGRTHVYQMFVVRVPAAKRDALVRGLIARGIGASVHFDPPAHLHRAYAGLDRRHGPLERTEEAARTCVTLPCGPEMTSEDVAYVSQAFRELYR
jgi:perosamine synthetase